MPASYTCGDNVSPKWGKEKEKNWGLGVLFFPFGYFINTKAGPDDKPLISPRKKRIKCMSVGWLAL